MSTSRVISAGGTGGISLLASVSGIDATSIAETTLFTVPSGDTAVILDIIVRCTAASGITTEATAGVGTNANEDDIFSSQELTGLTAAGDDFQFETTGTKDLALSGEVIKLGVDTGASGGTQTIAVDIIGYLVSSAVVLGSAEVGSLRTSGFRLTTETGEPVSTSDRTAQGTIYLTPYISNEIFTFDSSMWTRHETAEVSLALVDDGVTSGFNYDVFAYWTGSAIALELSAVWTGDTTRDDAVTREGGVFVKSSDHSRRLVGTIRASATDVTEDSEAKRFVANINNQVGRSCVSPTETANTWTYNTAAFRQSNDNTANRFEYITSLADMYLTVDCAGWCANNSSGFVATSGIGLGSTTVNSAQQFGHISSASGGNWGHSIFWSRYQGNPGLGYHAINWLEKASGAVTHTWVGDNGDPSSFQTGISGTVVM